MKQYKNYHYLILINAWFADYFSLYEPAFCVAILPVLWRLILSKLEFISYFNMSGKDLDDMTYEKFKFWKVPSPLGSPCCFLEIYSPKVLVIPRKRWLRSNMTEKLFTGTQNANKTIKQIDKK